MEACIFVNNFCKHRSNGVKTMLFEENQPLLVNAATAARLLGISERNLWQLKKDGNIPYVKIGKLTKYHIPTIEIWIDENTQNGVN